MHFEKRIPIFKDLGFREEAIPQLKAFVDLLWQVNESLNLVSRKMSFEELIDNHVIDSLLPLKKFPMDLKVVADLGTGGGFPGLIYAIQFPNTQFHLFEKSLLKQGYLRECKNLIPNIEIRGEIQSDLRNIELVTSRAFKPIDVTLDMSRDYYKKGGKYFLLKARREKIDEELVLARKQFNDLHVKIEPLISPVLEVERHLVLI